MSAAVATLAECSTLFNGFRAARERGDTCAVARLSDSWLTGRRFETRGELDELLELARSVGSTMPRPSAPIPNPLSLSDRAYFDTAAQIGYDEFLKYANNTVPAGTTLTELKQRVEQAKAVHAAWLLAHPQK